MRKPSRFLTFLLSFVPGVGHFYLGLMNRGFTFLAGFFGWIVFVAFLTVASGQEGFMALLSGLPIIWIYGLFDALHQRKRIAAGEEEVPDISPLSEISLSAGSGDKSKAWALVFSFVPGAGHLYLGLKEQGLQLMGSFFFSLFLMDWLHLTFIIFLIPVIWFYSLFDALQKASQPELLQYQEDVFFFDWLKGNHRLLAYVLIGTGVVLIVNRVVVQYIGWQYVEDLQTGIVALLLICGGVWLLKGSRQKEVPGSNDAAAAAEKEE